MYCGYSLQGTDPSDPCPECATALVYQGAPATWPARDRRMLRQKIWCEIIASGVIAIVFVIVLLIEQFAVSAATYRVLVSAAFGLATLMSVSCIYVATRASIDHSFPPLRSLWKPRGPQRVLMLVSPLAVVCAPLALSLGKGESWFSASITQWLLLGPAFIILLDTRRQLMCYHSVVQWKQHLRWHRMIELGTYFAILIAFVGLIALAAASSIGIYAHIGIPEAAMISSLAHIILGCGVACALSHVLR